MDYLQSFDKGIDFWLQIVATFLTHPGPSDITVTAGEHNRVHHAHWDCGCIR